MSRTRLPPTPMSGEFMVKDQAAVDGSDSFALPPAAIDLSKGNSVSRRTSKAESSIYFPASPTSPRLDPGQNASPPQGALKRPLEDFDLPPPPTRTRKIIQMKPKTQSPPKPAATNNKASPKGNGKNASNAAAPASKKKQPSATSAAGRKIARKTAHSLIERRRRSKMNEEFATLKNMIPACRGQDMHKLAILQASIEYVNYLEKCIQDLKMAGDHQKSAPPPMPPAPLSPTSPEVTSDHHDSYPISMSPELAPDSAATHNTSPMYSPRSRMPSTASALTEIPPSILPSPALAPIYPTERTLSSAWSSWTLPTSSRPSPTIQPKFSNASADVDHEASAALLMLNRDCRASIDSGKGGSSASSSSSVPHEDHKIGAGDAPRNKRMSVKDLLIS